MSISFAHLCICPLCEFQVPPLLRIFDRLPNLFAPPLWRPAARCADVLIDSSSAVSQPRQRHWLPALPRAMVPASHATVSSGSQSAMRERAMRYSPFTDDVDNHHVTLTVWGLVRIALASTAAAADRNCLILTAFRSAPIRATVEQRSLGVIYGHVSQTRHQARTVVDMCCGPVQSRVGNAPRPSR